MSNTRAISTFAFCLMLVLVPGSLFAQGNGPGGGGHTDSAGNNLALPVIWSDGVTKALRGTYGAPSFLGESFTDGLGVTWYLQQDPLNEWQAETFDGKYSAVHVDWIDWGDNLEAKAWYSTSVVRVETVLYQDLDVPLVGFEMGYLWGEGTSEMWGTTGNTYNSDQATVYSGCARMTIQKLTKDPTDPTFFVAWNPVTGAWTGDIGDALFNKAVWEAVEGSESPTSYSAEINIPGKVIYGYNWNLRKVGDGAGFYRLTFSLDGTNCPIILNTFFTEGTTQILLPVEEEVLAEAEEPGGGVAVIDYANNLTYIDVEILARSGKGGNTGKGGKGGNK